MIVEFICRVRVCHGSTGQSIAKRERLAKKRIRLMKCYNAGKVVVFLFYSFRFIVPNLFQI